MRSTEVTTLLLLLFTTLALSLTLPLPGRSLARALPLEISKRDAATTTSGSKSSSSGSKSSSAINKIKNTAAKKAGKKAKGSKSTFPHRCVLRVLSDANCVQLDDTSAGIMTHGDAPAGMAIMVAGTVVGILVLGGAGAGL